VVLAAILAFTGFRVFAPALSAEVARSEPAFMAILIGATLVFGVGLIDDLRPLSPSAKLAVEIVAAAIVMQAGLRIEHVTIADHTWELGLLAWPVTLVWVVGLTNAFNLIDGIDGLAAGVSVIAGGACAAILILRGHTSEALLLAALAGAGLGFLIYNFPPASIFLGDGGSLLFGFVLAATAITGWQKGATALAAGVPILIFALPIADSASTLVRRLRQGGDQRGSIRTALARLAQPDRAHIHHRLLGLGLSTRNTVLLLYAITLVLSSIAILTARLS
jgi:UDP-GlcNAc:undecaprenyl-phosphate/decaprenyl-phosphate GlcNAc-1-phosphate transferase